MTADTDPIEIIARALAREPEGDVTLWLAPARALIDRIRPLMAVEEREALFDIAFRSNGLAGDPSQWPSTIAYLALGGRIADGVMLDDEAALRPLPAPPFQPEVTP